MSTVPAGAVPLSRVMLNSFSAADTAVVPTDDGASLALPLPEQPRTRSALTPSRPIERGTSRCNRRASDSSDWRMPAPMAPVSHVVRTADPTRTFARPYKNLARCTSSRPPWRTRGRTFISIPGSQHQRTDSTADNGSYVCAAKARACRLTARQSPHGPPKGHCLEHGRDVFDDTVRFEVVDGRHRQSVAALRRSVSFR